MNVQRTVHLQAQTVLSVAAIRLLTGSDGWSAAQSRESYQREAQPLREKCPALEDRSARQTAELPPLKDCPLAVRRYNQLFVIFVNKVVQKAQNSTVYLCTMHDVCLPRPWRSQGRNNTTLIAGTRPAVIQTFEF